jgi:hypothetical protein
MSNFNRFQSGTALFLALGLTAGAVAPIVAPAPAFAQTTFYDVASNYWAKDFIQELSSRDIIKGFPDGSFRPNDSVTRSQFAAMVNKAFKKNKIRNAVNFVDVPSNYWATSAISTAYEMGFLAGYPGNVFNPEQNIPRVQVLVALANGLNYSASGSTTSLLQSYSDAANIPDYAVNSVAAATEKRIVVNYPSLNFLNPNQVATRADVAAFIYQSLVSSGEAVAINSAYIVGAQPVASEFRIPSGTTIPVKYQKEKILVTRDETAPVTLTVGANVSTADGRVLIPAESQIIGQLQPAQGGSQFVAKQLVMPNGSTMPFNASSQVITKTETVTKGTSTGTFLQDAALGAAAAAGVAAVTGDRAIATEEVLGGAAIGTLIALFLGQDKVDLISVQPNTDLNLKLGSDLVLSAK